MPKPKNFQVGSKFIVTHELQRTQLGCQDYLDKLAGRANAKFTFVTFDDMKRFKEVLQPDGSIKKVPTHPCKVYYGTFSQHAPNLKADNEIGYGIFVTVQETSSTKRESSDIGKTRALYVDRDGGQGLPSEWHLEPSMIVNSSPDNHHPYWLLQEPVQLTGEEFKANIIPLIAHYNGDEQCKDLPRVLRLPGFFNNKSKYGKPFLVTIHSLTDNRYTLEQIASGLKPVDTNKKHSNYTKKEIVPVEKKINVKSDLNSQEKLDSILDKYENILANSQQGTIHNTLLKSCKSFAGLVAFHCPEKLNQYKQKFHDIASNLECQGIWNVVSTTHDTIETGFNYGVNLPWDFLEFSDSKETSNLLDLNPNIVKLKSGVTLSVKPKQDLIHKPETDEIIGIAIAEKPIENYYTIGLFNKDLLADIQEIQNEYPELPVIVFPSAGWVFKNLNKLYELAETGQFYFADYNTKSFNEKIDFSGFTEYRLLNSDSWLKKYKPIFDEYEIFQRHFRWKNKLCSDVYTEIKYLTFPKDIEYDCDILLVKSPFGSGKTVGVIEFLKLLLGKNYVDFIALLGYRNSLNEQTMNRANTTGLYARSVKTEDFNGLNVNPLADENLRMIGGCVNSFQKIQNALLYREKTAIVIDEICSVLNHLLEGGTLKGNREAAIESVLQMVNESRLTIMMDANLNDDVVNLIKQLFPLKRVKVLENNNTFQPRQFYFLETGLAIDENKELNTDEYSRNNKYISGNLLSKCLELIKNNEKFVFLADSQKQCEKAEKMFLDQAEESNINLKIIRVDSRTTSDKNVQLFLENPDKFIAEENIDIVILSPSAESGVSIDIGKNDETPYFRAVFYDVKCCFNGVFGLSQHAMRIRDFRIPIYVSCPDFINFGSELNKFDKYVPELPYWSSRMYEISKQCSDNWILNAQESFGIPGELSKLIAEKVQDDLATNPLTQFALKQDKIRQYERSNVKLALIAHLSILGHTCIDLKQQADIYVNKLSKKAGEFVIDRKAEKIFNSVDITLQQLESLQEKDNNNDDVQCQVKKAELKLKTLPGIETTKSWSKELVLATLTYPKFLDNYLRIKQLQNPDTATELFKIRNANRIFNSNISFLSVVKDTKHQIDAYKRLEILKYIEMPEFTTGQIKEIVDKVYDENLWGLLNIKMIPKNKTYVKTIFTKMLDFFGLKIVPVLDDDGNHKRSETDRYYRAGVPKEFEPFTQDINTCFETRILQVKETATKLMTEYEIKVKERFEQQQLNPYNSSVQVNEQKQVSEFETRVKSLEQSLPIIKLSELYIELDGELPENIKNNLQDDEILAIHRIATQKAGEKLLAEF